MGDILSKVILLTLYCMCEVFVGGENKNRVAIALLGSILKARNPFKGIRIRIGESDARRCRPWDCC